jgi:hypothetical protein
LRIRSLLSRRTCARKASHSSEWHGCTQKILSMSWRSVRYPKCWGIYPKRNEQKLLEMKIIPRPQIKIEELRKRSRVGQCHCCQTFGHAASLCAAAPRCVTCGEGHLTPGCNQITRLACRCAYVERHIPLIIKTANIIRVRQSANPRSLLLWLQLQTITVILGISWASRLRTKPYQDLPSNPLCSKALVHSSTAKLNNRNPQYGRCQQFKRRIYAAGLKLWGAVTVYKPKTRPHIRTIIPEFKWCLE